MANYELLVPNFSLNATTTTTFWIFKTTNYSWTKVLIRTAFAFFICFTGISILQCAKICFSKFASDIQSSICNLLQPRRKPAILNNFSTPAVVAGPQKTFPVIVYNRGKTAFCCFQYRNTSPARLENPNKVDKALHQRRILFYFVQYNLFPSA